MKLINAYVLQRVSTSLGLRPAVFLLLIFLPLVLQVSAQSVEPSGCPPTYPTQCSDPGTTTRSLTWPQGVNVNVNIDPSFNQAQRDAAKRAFENWQSAGDTATTGGNNSGVRFTFTFNPTPPSMTPSAGTYNAQVWNRNSPAHPARGGDNAVQPNSGNTNIISQEMDQYPNHGSLCTGSINRSRDRTRLWARRMPQLSK